MPKPASSKSQQADLQQFSKNLVSVYETGYLNKKEAYKQTFIKGILAGLGGVIGATLMVALLLWILSLFHEVPLIGPVANTIQNTIESSQSK